MTKKTPTRRRKTAAAKRVDVEALALVLQEHALGLREMTATQVTVALALVKIFGAPRHDREGEETLHEEALSALE